MTNAIRKTMKSIQIPKRKSKIGGREGGRREEEREKERGREQTKIMK